MSALPHRSAAPAPRPRPTPRPRRPALEVVDPPRRVRRWLLAMAVTFLAGVGGISALGAAGAEAAFTARALEQDIAALERHRAELTGDVAELSSLDRIRTVATEELGMVPAEDPRYLQAAPIDQVPAAHHDDLPADPVKAARDGRW